MHELAIAQHVVQVAQHRAGDQQVVRLVLEVGSLSAVLPDAMRFCFALACEGTALEGAELDIVEVQGRGRCRQCQGELPMPRAFARCPACESTDIEWLSGEELRITELEVIHV